MIVTERAPPSEFLFSIKEEVRDIKCFKDGICTY